ncbi:MAG: uroporphyrinogen III methylase [Gammaproteobacteria bacterium]|nr:uroporphyrinogen III methylase [Gammaproteobacteria bacterium]
MKNTLIVVGAGIKFLSHLTTEAKVSIEKADYVLYLVNEPAMKEWIETANPNSESLDFLYDTNLPRNQNYLLISEYVLKALEKTKVLCLVMYGHPTFLAEPSIYSVNLATKNGHNTYVLPGISSEDCMLADLLIDPSSCGCQSYEATDFLIYDREYDTSCHLILWQAGMIGIKTNYQEQDPKNGLEILTEHLLKKYSEQHPVFLYEAAQYPSCKPSIEEVVLADLPQSPVSSLTTLYIPPNKVKEPNEFYVNKLNNINS